MIEWLKTKLIGSIADLFEAMIRGGEERILDCLAGTIITTYLLGRRLGFSYARLELKVQDQLKDGLAEDNPTEDWREDLRMLLDYFERQKR
ncbi:hypothetical protein PTH_2889 [Calderihabitans maritimus]|uniref:MazG-like family protein n=2 Tax=Calderihabitans maritimus TaxID=1246530 RepID=A0A1Z5HW01_9FIRM|nr:hypothetical protein PTH_2889 [Calderihabitans maritimus]